MRRVRPKPTLLDHNGRPPGAAPGAFCKFPSRLRPYQLRAVTAGGAALTADASQRGAVWLMMPSGSTSVVSLVMTRSSTPLVVLDALEQASV